MPGITADFVYTGRLSNDGKNKLEGLRLFDDQCNLIDEVLANPKWPAGDNTNTAERKTMERKSDLSWQSSAQAGGTPKSANSSGYVVYSGGGGGGTPTNTQHQTTSIAKILINEIQIAGVTANDEFIELYNPTANAVDLSSWSIQYRGSSAQSFSKKNFESGHSIPSGGYFLIAHKDFQQAETADMSYSLFALSGAGGSIFLVSNTATLTNGDEESIIDKVAYGSGNYLFPEGSAFTPVPPAGQSIQRKNFQDNGNNASDFEIQTCPSPKAPSRDCSAANQAPSAFFVYTPQNPQVGQEIIFNATSSTDSDGQIVSYEWSFGDGGTLISSSSTVSHIYSQFGSYQTSLTVFDNKSASSTPTVANIPVSISGADHIVISEILFNAQGSDEGKEFVELYNPTDNEIDLTNYSLRILTGDTISTELLAKFGSKTEDSVLIKGKSFFLVGFYSYIGNITADMTRTNSLPNSSSTVYLFNKNGGEVDVVFYSYAIDPGQSLERKAWVSNVCVLSRQNAEFLGNACDSNGDNDFDIREIPNPQNSLSLPEPRIAPTKPEKFGVQYAQNKMELSFEWDESRDYSGATSTLVYKIFDISNASTTLPVVESTSTATKITISEVGRDYQFSIQAFDADGLGSDAATSSINVLSFLSGLYFYQKNPQDGEILIDAYYGQYPFIPDLFNKGNTWKIAVFYLNSDAKNDLNNPSWQPNDLTDVLGLKYSQCAGGTGGNSLILPDINNCSGFPGGAVNMSFSFSQLAEDNHFIIRTVKSNGELGLDENDFITVAFYSVSSIPPSNPLNPDFQLVAKDKTKYYFGVEPERQKPIFNGEVIKNFDSANSKLNLSWPKAADADTPDNLLVYEIKYNNEDWASAGNVTGTSRLVSPGESFSISVRAKDDFNNYSTSTLSASWAYPLINFSLVQEVSGGWSANFGERNTISNASAANIQSVSPAGNLEFNKVVLRVKHL